MSGDGAGPATRTTVATLGTRLRRTHVQHGPAGWDVEHEHLLDPPPASTAALLRDLFPVRGDGVVAPVEEGPPGRLRYVVPGAVSLTTILRSPAGGSPLALALAERLGATVRAVGAIGRERPDAAGRLPAGLPPRLRRTLHCLGAPPQGDEDAGRFARGALEALGADGRAAVDRLVGGLEELPPGGPVVVHGELSLGNALTDEHGDGLAVIGADGARRGHPAVDLAWVLGELDELGTLHLPGDGRVAAWRAAFLRGASPDDAVLALAEDVAALRVLVHAHDYARYVAWNDQVQDLCALAARRLTAVPSQEPA